MCNSNRPLEFNLELKIQTALGTNHQYCGSAKVLCVYFQTLTFQTSTATQCFWNCTIFIISQDINSPEAFNWKIAFVVVVVGVLVYMCVISGIVCYGKVI